MTAMHRRAARREEQAAAALGTRRVHRRRGEEAPDVEPVRLASGAVLGPEVKSRKRLPRLITGAIAQARGYFGTTAIPVAVIYELGARGGLACLPLEDFARLIGIELDALPRSPRRPRKARRAEHRRAAIPPALVRTVDVISSCLKAAGPPPIDATADLAELRAAVDGDPEDLARALAEPCRPGTLRVLVNQGNGAFRPAPAFVNAPGGVA